jgi:hypothetical protein
VTDLLLSCGAAAGPVFVTTFLVEGSVRADYDPVRHPVSSLALGPGGWVQTLNFCLTGGLYLAGSLGLARARAPNDADPAIGRLASGMIAAAAVGLLGAGAFATDPVSGYPPGTPGAPSRRSTAGSVHDLVSIPTFLGIPAAALVSSAGSARRGRPGWAAYSAASGLGMLAGTVAATLAFTQAPALVAFGGLLQRAAVTTGFTWLTAAHIRALRRR